MEKCCIGPIWLQKVDVATKSCSLPMVAKSHVAIRYCNRCQFGVAPVGVSCNHCCPLPSMAIGRWHNIHGRGNISTCHACLRSNRWYMQRSIVQQQRHLTQTQHHCNSLYCHTRILLPKVLLPHDHHVVAITPFTTQFYLLPEIMLPRNFIRCQRQCHHAKYFLAIGFLPTNMFRCNLLLSQQNILSCKYHLQHQWIMVAIDKITT